MSQPLKVILNHPGWIWTEFKSDLPTSPWTNLVDFMEKCGSSSGWWKTMLSSPLLPPFPALIIQHQITLTPCRLKPLLFFLFKVIGDFITEETHGSAHKFPSLWRSCARFHAAKDGKLRLICSLQSPGRVNKSDLSSCKSDLFPNNNKKVQ